MAITSAFQADDVGSIPITRSIKKLNIIIDWSSGATVSVPACHAGGCGFESRLDRHLCPASSVGRALDF